jgi:hypothetical protein
MGSPVLRFDRLRHVRVALPKLVGEGSPDLYVDLQDRLAIGLDRSFDGLPI